MEKNFLNFMLEDMLKCKVVIETPGSFPQQEAEILQEAISLLPENFEQIKDMFRDAKELQAADSYKNPGYEQDKATILATRKKRTNELPSNIIRVDEALPTSFQKFIR